MRKRFHSVGLGEYYRQLTLFDNYTGRELRDTGDYGFLLPPDQIVPNYEEVFAGLKALVKYIEEDL